MESAYRAACDGDEQGGHQRVAVLDAETRGTHVAQAIPQLRDCGELDKERNHKAECHEYQRNGKQRIYLADNLIYGQYRCDDIICEDCDNPEQEVSEHRVFQQRREQGRRTEDKHRAHHDKQKDGENKHHTACASAKIDAHQLRQTCTVFADGEHAGEIVVHRSGKDTAEDYPEIG